MKKLLSAVWAISVLATGTAWAQAYPPNETGVTMGHWHLNTRDVEANKKMFVAMGGTAIKAGNFEVVRFPGVAVFLHLAQGAQRRAQLLFALGHRGPEVIMPLLLLDLQHLVLDFQHPVLG